MTNPPDQHTLRPLVRFHPVPHGGACGIRIPSPHPVCQALAEPVYAAEILADRLEGRSIACHVCGERWAVAS
jgi:hypothetical protein